MSINRQDTDRSTLKKYAPITVISASNSSHQYWRDLWSFRELFLILSWRDITVRYKQTYIGIAWALLRPFLTMVVFTIIFGKIARLPTESDAPYAVLVFSAMLPWQLFASAVSGSSDSLISNSSLLTKVYFPRLVMPASAVVTSSIDFFISFGILIGLMAWYRYPPSLQILSIPLWSLLTLLFSLSMGVWLASLNVTYRDFKYVVPFMIQFGLYISPVGFSSSVVPQKWQVLYSLNPMVGIIDGFRWAILGANSSFSIFSICTSVAVTLVLGFLGIKNFRRMEKKFADIV